MKQYNLPKKGSTEHLRRKKKFKKLQEEVLVFTGLKKKMLRKL